MSRTKTLLILRGLPGSGKSTLAETLAALANDSIDVCADDCWETPYWGEEGEFTMDGLMKAHWKCLQRVDDAMADGCSLIILHNTCTKYKEMKKYFDLAEQFGYQVHSTIVENRHHGESIHGVPADKLAEMKERFSIVL